MAVVGRPRSDESHRAILQAAYDLLAEDGLSGFTFERVAARAGVSRSTIYRWWPSKGALAAESALRALSAEVAFTPGPSPIENFRRRLQFVAAALKGRTGRIIAGMLAEGQQDPETIDIFAEGYLEPARGNLRALLRQAIAQGQLRSDFDVEMAIDVSFAALYHQLLLRRPLDESWVDRLPNLILSGSLAGVAQA
ncbi:MAG TPA: TetR/AcrR family transcriptional regulator [Aliidongia sp.]|nr:TetR/AcrR family transcriptional regulator [Aliidongia sp.]